MLSLETGKAICTMFNAMISSEKKCISLSEKLIQTNSLNVDVAQIFSSIANDENLKELKINDFSRYLSRGGKTPYTSKEIYDFVRISTRDKGKDTLTLCDLYYLIFKTETSERWHLNFNFMKLRNNIYRVNIPREAEDLIQLIIITQIELVKILSYYIKILRTKRNDFQVYTLYQLIREGHGYPTTKSIKNFYESYYMDGPLTERDYSILLKRLDIDRDNTVSFDDIERIFSIGSNPKESIKSESSSSLSLRNSSPSIKEVEEKFILYIKDMCLCEKKIEKAKKDFISMNSDFNIITLFEFLNPLFYLSNINEKHSRMKPKVFKDSLTKLNLYISDKERDLLMNRVNSLNREITLERLAELILPLFCTREELVVEQKPKVDSFLGSTVKNLKQLIQLMILCEAKLNNIKKDFSAFFQTDLLTEYFNTQLVKGEVPYVMFGDFYRYLKVKGVLDSTITQDEVELAFRRLNVSQSNKLSMFELSHGVSYIE